MADDKSFSLREAWNNRLETIVSSRKELFIFWEIRISPYKKNVQIYFLWNIDKIRVASYQDRTSGNFLKLEEEPMS